MAFPTGTGTWRTLNYCLNPSFYNLQFQTLPPEALSPMVGDLGIVLQMSLLGLQGKLTTGERTHSPQPPKAFTEDKGGDCHHGKTSKSLSFMGLGETAQP